MPSIIRKNVPPKSRQGKIDYLGRALRPVNRRSKKTRGRSLKKQGLPRRFDEAFMNIRLFLWRNLKS